MLMKRGNPCSHKEPASGQGGEKLDSRGEQSAPEVSQYPPRAGLNEARSSEDKLVEGAKPTPFSLNVCR